MIKRFPAPEEHVRLILGQHSSEKLTCYFANSRLPATNQFFKYVYLEAARRRLATSYPNFLDDAVDLLSLVPDRIARAHPCQPTDRRLELQKRSSPIAPLANKASSSKSNREVQHPGAPL